MSSAEAVASFGEYLRSLREAKGGSLEDMARSTRVGIRHLEALEEERLVDLPSPVFVKGFIRAYCGFLRENPEDALSRYQSLLGERAAAQAASAPPGPRTAWAYSSVLVGLLLLVVLGAGILLINLTVKRSGGTSVAAVKTEQETSAPGKQTATPAVRDPAPVSAPAPVHPVTPAPALATPPVASAPPATVADPPKAPAAPATAAIPAPTRTTATKHRLVIKAIEPTWIRVQPDEGVATEELLPVGASREWTAERRFVVTIGNAGGVEVQLNGKPLAPLGAKGTVIQRLELPAPPASG
jgi:cytoskeleton protein RodZ